MSEYIHGWEGELDVSLFAMLDIPKHGQENVDSVRSFTLGTAEIGVRVFLSIMFHFEFVLKEVLDLQGFVDDSEIHYC